MQFPSQFFLISLACAALTVVSACSSEPTAGYYDSNGRYVPYNPQNRNAAIHAPNSAAMRDGEEETYNVYRTRVVRPYDRTGFYDYNGFYIALDGGLEIPQDMFPPEGMCRIWFLNRPYDKEPQPESCTGIQSRVPRGAYIVYSGED